MPNELQTIGARLKRLRLALGYENQADLCREIGVIPSRWNQYETGARRITFAIAIRMKKRFNVPLDFIYTGDQSGLPVRVADKLPEAAE